MNYTGPDDEADPHARFFLLAGMVRHEFWLHQLRPEDYGFVADADSLTLKARRQDSPGTACEMKVDEQELREDLSSLARRFFKMHCSGAGPLSRRRAG
jgi:hypothetical protein